MSVQYSFGHLFDTRFFNNNLMLSLIGFALNCAFLIRKNNISRWRCRQLLEFYHLHYYVKSSGESRIIFLPARSSICQYPPKISAINIKKQSRARLLLAHPVFVVAENNSIGHSQHSSLMPCMTQPIVLRKQRSGKPGFWDVNDWEIFDQFVRHIRWERGKLLMQQNVLPRSSSTKNLLYLCDQGRTQGGVLGLTPPLELDILQKLYYLRKEIKCFRIPFCLLICRLNANTTE